METLSTIALIILILFILLIVFFMGYIVGQFYLKKEINQEEYNKNLALKKEQDKMNQGFID